MLCHRNNIFIFLSFVVYTINYFTHNIIVLFDIAHWKMIGYSGALIPWELEFIKVANSIINPPAFKSKTKERTLSDRKIEKLKNQVHNQVENIKRRNEWLEASNRKNYIHEYDALQSTLSALNKDPNAIGIRSLENRMEYLRDWARQSLSTK